MTFKRDFASKETKDALNARPETGWLIERSTGRGPAYIFVDSNEMLGWTHDNLKAIRFARRADAEQVTRMIDDAEKITEHQWG